MRFEAVIFDLDGTLLATLNDVADAMNKVLSKHDLPTHTVDAYRYFVGDGVGTVVRRTLPEGQYDDAEIGRFVNEFRDAYQQNWNLKTRPYAGVPEMLGELAARGLKLAVLSNKPDDFTQQCVDAFLSDWAFDIVMGHREDMPPKPNPKGALEIAEKLGVSPEKVLYVGDTNIDMRTAVGAGMYPVGALWGFRTRDELRRSGAEALIEQPQDILGLLE